MMKMMILMSNENSFGYADHTTYMYISKIWCSKYDIILSKMHNNMTMPFFM